MLIIIIVTFSAVLDIGTFSAILHTYYISRQNENIHFQKENTHKLTLLQDRCAAFSSAVFDNMSIIMQKTEITFSRHKDYGVLKTPPTKMWKRRFAMLTISCDF